MFFVALLLFFSKLRSIYSIECIVSQSKIPGVLGACEFSLGMANPMPTDDDLTGVGGSCEMKNPALVSMLGHNDGSCYADVTIDYSSKMMDFTSSAVNSALSLLPPYNGMMGIMKGIERVIQYKIYGDPTKNQFFMLVRYQCRTSTNCALTRLRELLPSLIQVATRTAVFEMINTLLNKDSPPPGTPVT